MSTLMSAGGSDWSRRCDAKCYDAKGPVCDCICGGKNHGKGKQQAQTDMERDFCAGLDKAAERAGLDPEVFRTMKVQLGLKF